MPWIPLTETTFRSFFVSALARRDVRAVGALAIVQVVLVALYFAVTIARPTGLRYVLYPVVWTTVGVWVVLRRSSPSASMRVRLIAAGVAVSYLLVLAWIGGLVAPSPTRSGGTGLRVVFASPGWGPAIRYAGSTVQLVFVPYLVVGYLALAYLVYGAVVKAAGAALSGVVGLASCVSCGAPVLASLVTGVAGGSSGLTATVYAVSIDLSTAAFLLAVGLLYYRPTFDASAS